MEEDVHHDVILNRLDLLVYLDCVVKEILRFSPPLDGGARTLTMNDRLPNSGIQLLMQHVTFIDGGLEVNVGGHIQGLTVMPKYIGVKIKFDSEI
ncbi:unnamed protein product [Rotaria sp. Silwood1]|nr:unnamed protein product [Rotaria sp. Silwood1]CAF4712754.1 unnamed protein product [Rotaria sp. Silwood1]